MRVEKQTQIVVHSFVSRVVCAREGFMTWTMHMIASDAVDAVDATSAKWT